MVNVVNGEMSDSLSCQFCMELKPMAKSATVFLNCLHECCEPCIDKHKYREKKICPICNEAIIGFAPARRTRELAELLLKKPQQEKAVQPQLPAAPIPPSLKVDQPVPKPPSPKIDLPVPKSPSPNADLPAPMEQSPQIDLSLFDPPPKTKYTFILKRFEIREILLAKAKQCNMTINVLVNHAIIPAMMKQPNASPFEIDGNFDDELIDLFFDALEDRNMYSAFFKAMEENDIQPRHFGQNWEYQELREYFQSN